MTELVQVFLCGPSKDHKCDDTLEGARPSSKVSDSGVELGSTRTCM